MGKVQQRAGGGKATVENLAAGNVKSGVTVTVKQGSKTVQQVTGSLNTPVVLEFINSTYARIAQGIVSSSGTTYTLPPGTYSFTVVEVRDVSPAGTPYVYVNGVSIGSVTSFSTAGKTTAYIRYGTFTLTANGTFGVGYSIFPPTGYCARMY